MRTVSPNSSIVSNGLSREDTQNEDESILQQPQVMECYYLHLALDVIMQGWPREETLNYFGSEHISTVL